MQNKVKFLKAAAIVLCALFVAVLVFSEAFAYEHHCTGEDCIVCQAVASMKLVSFVALVFHFAVVTVLYAPRVEQALIVHDTLVSRKLKLTI